MSSFSYVLLPKTPKPHENLNLNDKKVPASPTKPGSS